MVSISKTIPSISSIATLVSFAKIKMEDSLIFALKAVWLKNIRTKGSAIQKQNAVKWEIWKIRKLQETIGFQDYFGLQ